MNRTRYILADPGVDPLAPIPPNPRPRISAPVLIFIVAMVLSVGYAIIGATSKTPVDASGYTATPTPTPTITMTITPTPVIEDADLCRIQRSYTPVYATVIIPKMVDRLVAQTVVVQVTRVVAYPVTREVTRQVEVTIQITTTPQPTYTLQPTYTPQPTQTPWIIVITQPVIITPTYTSSPTSSPTPTAAATVTPGDTSGHTQTITATPIKPSPTRPAATATGQPRTSTIVSTETR